VPPPDSRNKVLSREEVYLRLTESVWECTRYKTFGTADSWRTKFGFYFTVPFECTEEYFETEILADLRKNGWKRNV